MISIVLYILTLEADSPVQILDYEVFIGRRTRTEEQGREIESRNRIICRE